MSKGPQKLEAKRPCHGLIRHWHWEHCHSILSPKCCRMLIW